MADIANKDSVCAKENLSLADVQSTALAVFKKIDSICQEQGLRYWLAFGTLLGAVRHHGFIPWDDDIDLVMPRPDYERFLQYFRDHSESLLPLVAINPIDRPGTPFLITRVSDTTFKMIGEFGDYVEDMGVFVDVYPLDGLGDDLSKAEELKSKSQQLVACYTQSGGWPFYRDQRPLHRMAKKILNVRLKKPSVYLAEIAELCATYSFDDSKYVTCLAWVPYFGFAERQHYGQTSRIAFEDAKANIPSAYDDILTLRYGNYMELPPVEDRVPHHFYSIVKR